MLANPADRLYAIMESALAQQGGYSAYGGWCEVLGVEQHDRTAFYRRTARLAALVSGVRRDVMAIEGEEDGILTLTHYDEIEQVLAAFPAIASKNMQEVMRPLTRNTGLHALKLASRVLRNSRTYWTIPDETLADLRAAVENLRESLGGSDISASDADWIRGLLDELDDALASTGIDGPDQVMVVADRLVGGLARQPVFMERIRDSRFGRNIQVLAELLEKSIKYAGAFGVGIAIGPTGAPDPTTPELPPVVTVILRELDGTAAEIQPGQHTLSIPGPAGSDEIVDAEIVEDSDNGPR